MENIEKGAFIPNPKGGWVRPPAAEIGAPNPHMDGCDSDNGDINEAPDDDEKFNVETADLNQCLDEI